MIIGIASDHGGYQLKEVLKPYLVELGHEVKDYGTNSEESVDYPDYGAKLARAVAQGECNKGIAICGSGQGIMMSANKVKGIRCALPSDVYSAEMTAMHNNANMIALGGRVHGQDLAKRIVRAYLETEFEGGRHQRRIDKITELEENF